MRVNMDFIRRYCRPGDKITVRADRPDFYYGSGLYNGLEMTVSKVITDLMTTKGKPSVAVMVKYQPMLCKPVLKNGEMPELEHLLRYNDDGTPFFHNRKMSDEEPEDFWLEVDDHLAEGRTPNRTTFRVQDISEQLEVGDKVYVHMKNPETCLDGWYDGIELTLSFKHEVWNPTLDGSVTVVCVKYQPCNYRVLGPADDIDSIERLPGLMTTKEGDPLILERVIRDHDLFHYKVDVPGPGPHMD